MRYIVELVSGQTADIGAGHVHVSENGVLAFYETTQNGYPFLVLSPTAWLELRPIEEENNG